MTLLARVADLLNEAGIPFAIIGASALAAHGVSRSTLDIDVLVTDRRTLRRDFWILADATIEIRPGDDSDPLAGVVRVTAAGQRDIDIVVGRAAWQTHLLASTVRLELQDAQVPVVDAPGLIMLKLYAGGRQDLWDIEQLLAAGSRAELAAAVDERVSVLPADARAQWDRLKS